MSTVKQSKDYSGWLILILTFLASMAVSAVKAHSLPEVIGGALGLILFPVLAFALCGALTKVVAKRPMRPFGVVISFFGTWAFMVLAVISNHFLRNQ